MINLNSTNLLTTEAEHIALDVLSFKAKAEQSIESYIVDAAHAIAKDALRTVLLILKYRRPNVTLPDVTFYWQWHHCFCAFSGDDDCLDDGTTPYAFSTKHREFGVSTSHLMISLAESKIYGEVFKQEFLKQMCDYLGEYTTESWRELPVWVWHSSVSTTEI